LQEEAMQPEAFDREDFHAAHEAMSLRYDGQLAAALGPAISILSDKDQLIVADILALRCVVMHPCPTPDDIERASQAIDRYVAMAVGRTTRTLP
jgi:hypothetical protein